MIKLLAMSLALATSMSFADVDLVPLDMELGYWETTTEMFESDAMKKVLESLPESKRAQFSEMMKSRMQKPIGKQCITADSFTDFAEKFKTSMGGNSDCRFTIKKSTAQEFIAELNCAGNATTIHTKVIDAKRQESNIVNTTGAMGQNKIRTVAQWKSSTCPAGV